MPVYVVIQWCKAVWVQHLRSLQDNLKFPVHDVHDQKGCDYMVAYTNHLLCSCEQSKSCVTRCYFAGLPQLGMALRSQSTAITFAQARKEARVWWLLVHTLNTMSLQPLYM